MKSILVLPVIVAGAFANLNVPRAISAGVPIGQISDGQVQAPTGEIYPTVPAMTVISSITVYTTITPSGYGPIGPIGPIITTTSIIDIPTSASVVPETSPTTSTTAVIESSSSSMTTLAGTTESSNGAITATINSSIAVSTTHIPVSLSFYEGQSPSVVPSYGTNSTIKTATLTSTVTPATTSESKSASATQTGGADYKGAGSGLQPAAAIAIGAAFALF